MKNKLKKSQIIKLIILIVIFLVLAASGVMIYKTFFAGSNSSRFNGIENYKLTNKEIDSAKEKLNTLDNIKSIDIYTNSKILRIYIKLTDDIEFDKVKEISNQTLSSFSEENLKFYDVEVFVESLNDKSTVYPKIGYKHKTNSEFVW